MQCHAYIYVVESRLTYYLVNPGRNGHKDCHTHSPEQKLKGKIDIL